MGDPGATLLSDNPEHFREMVEIGAAAISAEEREARYADLLQRIDAWREVEAGRLQAVQREMDEWRVRRREVLLRRLDARRG